MKNLDEILKSIPENQRKQEIESALARISEENQKFREAGWNIQLEILCKKGFPKVMGVKEEMLLQNIEPLKDRFLSESGKYDCIVLPPKLITPHQKVQLIQLNGKKGFTDLWPSFENAEGVQRPNMPYLALDVEPGFKMRGKSPYDCIEIFQEQKRLAGTVDEAEIHLIYWPETLEYQGFHGIDCPGSRGEGGSVPFLGDLDGRPELSARHPGHSDSDFGSFSLGGIFIP